MRCEEALREAATRLEAAGCPESRPDAEVLLADVLGTDRARLLLERSAPLGPRELKRFDRSIARRLNREPVAYITGEREFWSLGFKVTRAVLIPRPETETLVEEGLVRLRESGAAGARPGKVPARKTRVIDVGTGSGCVAVALAHDCPDVTVLAIDCSARALKVAAGNIARHGLERRIRLAHGDLIAGSAPFREAADSAKGRMKAQLIVANPPYVANEEWKTLQPEIRDWEPARALRGGADGLDVHRGLVREAPEYLLPEGAIAIEVGAGQARAVALMLEETRAFGKVRIVKDLAGIDRVVSARRTG